MPDIPADRRAKSIFLELGGSGLVYSLNYDTRFAAGRNDGFGVRAGISALGISGRNNTTGEGVNATIVTLPLMLNYIIGQRRSSLELGAGITMIYLDADGNVDVDGAAENFAVEGFGPAAALNVGYRAQPILNGPIFRFTWSPIISGETASLAWLGISIGYAFK